jgi:hypothetical protein
MERVHANLRLGIEEEMPVSKLTRKIWTVQIRVWGCGLEVYIQDIWYS